MQLALRAGAAGGANLTAGRPGLRQAHTRGKWESGRGAQRAGAAAPAQSAHQGQRRPGVPGKAYPAGEWATPGERCPACPLVSTPPPLWTVMPPRGPHTPRRAPPDVFRSSASPRLEQCNREVCARGHLAVHQSTARTFPAPPAACRYSDKPAFNEGSLHPPGKRLLGTYF